MGKLGQKSRVTFRFQEEMDVPTDLASTGRLEDHMEVQAVDRLPLFSDMLNQADGSNFLLASDGLLETDSLMGASDDILGPDLPDLRTENIWTGNERNNLYMGPSEPRNSVTDAMEDKLPTIQNDYLLLVEMDKEDDKWLYLPENLESEEKAAPVSLISPEQDKLQLRQPSSFNSVSRRIPSRRHSTGETRRRSQRATTSGVFSPSGISGESLVPLSPSVSSSVKLQSRIGSSVSDSVPGVGTASVSHRAGVSSLRQNSIAVSSYKFPPTLKKVGSVSFNGRNSSERPMLLEEGNLSSGLRLPSTGEIAGRNRPSETKIISEVSMASGNQSFLQSPEETASMVGSLVLKRTGSLDSFQRYQEHSLTSSPRSNLSEASRKGGDSLLNRDSLLSSSIMSGVLVASRQTPPLLSNETPPNLRTTLSDKTLSLQDTRRRSSGSGKMESLSAWPSPNRRSRGGRLSPSKVARQSGVNNTTSNSTPLTFGRPRGIVDASSGFNSSSFRALRFHEVTSVCDLKSTGATTSLVPPVLQTTSESLSPFGMRTNTGRQASVSSVTCETDLEQTMCAVQNPVLSTYEASPSPLVSNTGFREGGRMEEDGIVSIEGRRAGSHSDDKPQIGTQGTSKVKRVWGLHRNSETQAKGSSDKWQGMDDTSSIRFRSNTVQRRSVNRRHLALSSSSSGHGHEQEVNKYYGSFPLNSKSREESDSSDEGLMVEPEVSEEDIGKRLENRVLLEDEEEGALADVEADSDTHAERGEDLDSLCGVGEGRSSSGELGKTRLGDLLEALASEEGRAGKDSDKGLFTGNSENKAVLVANEGLSFHSAVRDVQEAKRTRKSEDESEVEVEWVEVDRESDCWSSSRRREGIVIEEQVCYCGAGREASGNVPAQKKASDTVFAGVSGGFIEQVRQWQGGSGTDVMVELGSERRGGGEAGGQTKVGDRVKTDIDKSREDLDFRSSRDSNNSGQPSVSGREAHFGREALEMDIHRRGGAVLEELDRTESSSSEGVSRGGKKQQEEGEIADHCLHIQDREADSSCLEEVRLKRPYVERGFLACDGSGEEHGSSSACSPSVEGGKLFGELVEDVKAQIEGWKMEDLANRQLVESSASDIDADHLIASHELRRSSSGQAGKEGIRGWGRDEKGLVREETSQPDGNLNQGTNSAGRLSDANSSLDSEHVSEAGGASVANLPHTNSWVDPRGDGDCRISDQGIDREDKSTGTGNEQIRVEGFSCPRSVSLSEDATESRENSKAGTGAGGSIQEGRMGTNSGEEKSGGGSGSVEGGFGAVEGPSGTTETGTSEGPDRSSEAGVTQSIPKRRPTIAKPSIRTYKPVPVGIRLSSSGFSSGTEQLMRMAMVGSAFGGTGSSSRPGSSAKSNSSDPYEWERGSSVADSDISTPSTMLSRNMTADEVLDLDDFVNGTPETMEEDRYRSLASSHKTSDKGSWLSQPLADRESSPVSPAVTANSKTALSPSTKAQEGQKLARISEKVGSSITEKSRKDAQPTCGCTIL